MKRKIIITATLLCFFTVVYAYFADINGKWSAMLKGPEMNSQSAILSKLTAQRLPAR